MAAARGPSWRRTEVLDLLDLWGEAKVQSALRESHRNLDVYGDIAKRMEERGYFRNAEECHSKTKAMRQVYKRVLTHNAKSGNSPTNCAYFEELDRILKGDPTVKKRRLVHSLPRVVLNDSEDGNQLNDQDPHMADGISLPSSAEQTIQQSSSDQQDNTETTDNSMVDEDATQILLEIITGNNEQVRTVGENPHTSREVIQPRNADDIAPDAAVSNLSPSSRIAFQEKQRQKASSIAKVGEAMLRQSSREHRAMLEASHRDHCRLLSFLERSQEEDRKTNQTVCELFKDAVDAMTAISRCVSERVAAASTITSAQHSLQTGPIPNQYQANTFDVPHFSLSTFGTNLHPQIHDNAGVASTYPQQHQAKSLQLNHNMGTNCNLNYTNTMSDSANVVSCDTRGFPQQDCSTSLSVSKGNTTRSTTRGHFVFVPRGDSGDYLEDLNGSPDMVGTHVWGETPCDTQFARDNFRPFSYVSGIDRDNCSTTLTGRNAGTDIQAHQQTQALQAQTSSASLQQGESKRVIVDISRRQKKLNVNDGKDAEAGFDLESLEQSSDNTQTKDASERGINIDQGEPGASLLGLEVEPSLISCTTHKTKNLEEKSVKSGRPMVAGRRCAEKRNDNTQAECQGVPGQSKCVCKPKIIYSPDV